MDEPQKSEAEQRAFFERVHESTLKAQTAGGRIEHCLDIAGTTVRLVFAGDRLVRELVPALSHRAVAPAVDADVTFNIWDSDTTGVAMPPPPCDRTHFTDRGDIWGFGSERFRTAFHWIECSVNLMDRQSKTAIFWVQTADTLPFWTKASPLRTLFQWWMEMNGRQLLHAAAIGNGDGGLLLTGPGGTGKSTTALAALAAGFKYVADDYLIVSLDPEPRAHSLYCTAKLNQDQVAAFPQFRRLIACDASNTRDKVVLQLHPAMTSQIAPSLPLKAVLTPRVAGRYETTVEPVSRDALCRAAAFTTMSQLPYAGRYTHEFISELTARLPGMGLALGKDLEGISRRLAALLSEPNAGSAMSTLATGPEASAEPLPLITVIIPVYNGAAFLRQAIDSVVAQAHPAVEIIVVDDGSEDDIDGVVASLDVDVRFFRQENAGAAAARNRGIRDASGEFIAFLDVDDLWPENNLKTLVEAMRADTLDVVHGHAQLMQLREATNRYEYVGNPAESFPYYIGAAMFRRSVFERVGLFDAQLQFAEDTDWFKRAHECGIPIRRLPHVSLLVRRHGQNMTRGKSLVELNTLRVFKLALDRQRQHRG